MTPAMTRQELRGVGVGTGIAEAPLRLMAAPAPTPPETASSRSAAEEQARVQAATDAVARELHERAEHSGGTSAEVLSAQALMTTDPMVQDDVAQRLTAGATAERAVYEAFSAAAEQFRAAGGYLAERVSDLRDISARLIAELSGQPAPGIPDSDEPFILVAHDLAPADTALLDPALTVGIVTFEGGPTSHTAILAREKNVPAIVGLGTVADLVDGMPAILDAATGVLLIAPDDGDSERARDEAAERASAADRRGPGALADGTPVALLANIGRAEQAEPARTADAEGIGLFRTEFLFLDRDTAPSVEEQRAQYATVARTFAGQKVVVRLLDAGADKPLAFLQDAPEDNPALGVRGIRALRRHESILRDQLSALAGVRAELGADADLWVMAPMVATVEEAEYVRDILAEFELPMAGVMIEVPSAALLAGHILNVVDFVSLGTNDLTQYTLAADRLLGRVADLQDPWHPAVLQLIRTAGMAGRARDKPVGVCGEAAADPLLAAVLVGLGVDSLSMSPTAIPAVRAELARTSPDDAARAALAACAARDADGARAAARAVLHPTDPAAARP